MAVSENMQSKNSAITLIFIPARDERDLTVHHSAVRWGLISGRERAGRRGPLPPARLPAPQDSFSAVGGVRFRSVTFRNMPRMSSRFPNLNLFRLKFGR